MSGLFSPSNPLLKQQTEQEKLKQQQITAEFAERAQEMASWSQTGTPKRTKRKTDWFGLVAVGVIILIVVGVVLLLR